MKQDTQGTADTGCLLAKKIRTSTPTETCDDGGTKERRREGESERRRGEGRVEGREERERREKGREREGGGQREVEG